MMLFNLLYICFLLSSHSAAQDRALPPAEDGSDRLGPPPAIHYVIERRGGAFAPNWTANLPHLAEQLKVAESRFNFTRREVKGNKIVRVPKAQTLGGGETDKLLGEFGRIGNWFSRMRIGTPAQKIQLDIDMLTRDFSMTTTTSSTGSRFEDFFSSSYASNQFGIIPFPNCQLPADNIRLPTINVTQGISFSHCKPRRQSRDTLGPSGALMGLAPSPSLSQMDSNIPSFIQQLIEAKHIREEVFSITLISSEQGILSLGGTIQEQIQTVENAIEGNLKPKQMVMGAGEKSQQASEMGHAVPSTDGPPAAPGQGDQAGGAATHGEKKGMLAAAMAQPVSGEIDGAKANVKRDLPPSPDTVPQASLERRQDPPGPPPQAAAAAAAPAPDTPPVPAPAPDNNGAAEKVPTFDDMNPFNRAGRMKQSQKGQHLPSWKDGWKWSPIEGAAGWWQILLRGIWADQVKVMKNQPCIIDINTPFILAPPLAAKAFYASISGSYRLPPPYSNFYAYPCNNPPYLHFEFGGWRFPIMRGTKSKADHRGANGKFSLGKVSDDSGYCVGAVVETRMGVGDASPVRRGGGNERFNVGFESGMLAGNGLRDVWVLGEPVFRGMGVVFDMKTKEVGFRTY